MTKKELSQEEIYEKAMELGFGQNTVTYIERELETKICKECCHLLDPGNFEYSLEGIEEMSFCSKCGGELEENTNLDQLDCACCGVSLLEDEEGHVTKDRKHAVCYECYDYIPEVYVSPEEKELRAHYQPEHMLSPDQLIGKTIVRAYFANWNGTFVVHTADNGICATYSNYDMHSGHTEHNYIEDLADFYRLCK